MAAQAEKTVSPNKPKTPAAKNFNQSFAKAVGPVAALKAPDTLTQLKSIFEAKKASLSQFKSSLNKAYAPPDKNPNPSPDFGQTYGGPSAKTGWTPVPKTEPELLKSLRAPYLRPEKITQDLIYFPKHSDPLIQKLNQPPKLLKALQSNYIDPATLQDMGSEHNKKTEELKWKHPMAQLLERAAYWESQGYKLVNQSEHERIYQMDRKWSELKAKLPAPSGRLGLVNYAAPFLSTQLIPRSKVTLTVEPYHFKQQHENYFNFSFVRPAIHLAKHGLVQALAVCVVLMFANNQVPQHLWRYVLRSKAAIITSYHETRYSIASVWPRAQALPITIDLKENRIGMNEKDLPVPTLRMVAGIDDNLSEDHFELIAHEIVARNVLKYSKIELALYYKRHLGQSVPYYVVNYDADHKEAPRIAINAWTPAFYDSFKR